MWTFITAEISLENIQTSKSFTEMFLKSINLMGIEYVKSVKISFFIILSYIIHYSRIKEISKMYI